MKLHPVGAELFHGDGPTHMTLIIAFRNFAKAYKKLNAIFFASIHVTVHRNRFLF